MKLSLRPCGRPGSGLGGRLARRLGDLFDDLVLAEEFPQVGRQDVEPDTVLVGRREYAALDENIDRLACAVRCPRELTLDPDGRRVILLQEEARDLKQIRSINLEIRIETGFRRRMHPVERSCETVVDITFQHFIFPFLCAQKNNPSGFNYYNQIEYIINPRFQ